MRILGPGLALAATLALGAGEAAAAPPTDPQAAQQQPLQIMRVSEALDLAGPLADVLVANPDTGLDLTHPDLAPRLYSLPGPVPAPDAGTFGGNPPMVAAGAPGWDLIGTLDPPNENPDPDPSDPAGRSGHGTATAGVLGAAWNNGQGGAGVAPNARLVALRSCWDGDQCYDHIQPAAFDWASDRGVRVISLSWLSNSNNGEINSIARNSNTLFVTIPSGNGGSFDADPTSPFPCGVNLANVICVSTSAPDDGLDCGAYGPEVVDVAAPTQNSVTTQNGGGFQPTGCATSYAAPTVAGVATILFGMRPQATPAEVKQAIVASARPAPAWQGRSVSGGIVDAEAAVRALGGGVGPAPLELEVTAKRKQVAERLAVKASCSVACDLKLSAKGRAGGDRFKSKKSEEDLSAGIEEKLPLEFSRRAEREISGERGKAKITVGATSASGDAREVVEVKLKG
jgi:hypothetical protein